MINMGGLHVFWRIIPLTTSIFSFENELCTGIAAAPGNFLAVETSLLLY